MSIMKAQNYDGVWITGYYAKVKNCIDDTELHVIIPEDAMFVPHEGISEFEIIDVSTLTTEETPNMAADLLNYVDFSNWKYPWLAQVVKLSLEYLTLEGLSDAMRATTIPDELLDIFEKELNNDLA